MAEHRIGSRIGGLISTLPPQGLTQLYSFLFSRYHPGLSEKGGPCKSKIGG